MCTHASEPSFRCGSSGRLYGRGIISSSRLRCLSSGVIAASSRRMASSTSAIRRFLSASNPFSTG
ncbi:hypothetical protein [Bacteroides uniformis]|uniref:hypothetical protein n=1 Tax=Bacteroides uniformis TaxID=820 RepID=UPI003F51ED68